MGHHYFRVCFVCQPGGSRKTEYYVLGTMKEVKEAVMNDLENDPYHALFYGEAMLLQCWYDGEKVSEIDLAPFLSYRLSDRKEPVTFEEGDTAPLDMEEERDGVPLYDLVSDGTIEAIPSIAWDKVKLPALKGTPLPEGEPGITTSRSLRAAAGTHRNDRRAPRPAT